MDKQAASSEHHAHRWKMEEPQGRTSHAVCKDCGAERDFSNWLADGDFLTREERRGVA